MNILEIIGSVTLIAVIVVAILWSVGMLRFGYVVVYTAEEKDEDE